MRRRPYRALGGSGGARERWGPELWWGQVVSVLTDCPNLVIEGITFSTSSAHHTTTGIMGVTLNACTLRQGVVEKASTSPSTRTVMVPTATHRSDAGRAPPRSRNVGAEVVTPSFHGGVKAGTAQKPSLARPGPAPRGVSRSPPAAADVGCLCASLRLRAATTSAKEKQDMSINVELRPAPREGNDQPPFCSGTITLTRGRHPVGRGMPELGALPITLLLPP